MLTVAVEIGFQNVEFESDELASRGTKVFFAGAAVDDFQTIAHQGMIDHVLNF